MQTTRISPVRRCSRLFRRALIALVLAAILIVPASRSSAGVQLLNIKLSGDVLTDRGVWTVKLSPDGNWAVFSGDLELKGMAELYSAPARGGTRVRLSGDHLINGGSVREYEIAPNNQRVVFRADKDHDEDFELWSVPISGGTPVKLNQGFILDEDVSSFRISPDSQYVVYTVDSIGGKPINIWSVPIAGGWQVKLNGDVGIDGEAFSPKISADSQWVVYIMQYEGSSVHHLYSAPIYGSITGSDRIKLNKDPVLYAAGVSNFEITPNGERVVYRARQDQVSVEELFSVPIRGSAATGVKLNPNFVEGQNVNLFEITPNSTWVVYQADQEVMGRNELYSVPTVGGSAPVRLTAMLSFTNPEGGVADDFEITPNSLGVVFRVNPAAANSYDLYASTLDGSVWRKLNPALPIGKTVETFRITPNNWGVVYWSNIDGVGQLYSRDIYANQQPRQLTNVSGTQLVTSTYKITPNSQYVVYAASRNTVGMFELFSFPTLGTNYALTLRWNLPFTLAESDVVSFRLMPDSSTLIYLADREADEVLQLYYAYYGFPSYLPDLRR